MTTINARIKKVRKEAGMNQKEFSESIGVTQSGVSYMEQDGRNVSDITVKGICNYFNINEDWLRFGKEPMYIQQPTFSLDQFVRDHQGTDLEIEIMKAYFELDPDVRKIVLNHFKARFSAAAQAKPAASEPSVEELEAEYKKSVLGSARNTGSIASSTTEGTGKASKVSNE